MKVLKKSVTVRSLFLMIVLSTAILLIMEISSYYYLTWYERGAMKNYTESLELYCSYWDNRLAVINNSLLTLTNDNDNTWWNVCHSQDELTFQTGKKILMNRMSDIAWNYSDEIMVFAYIPERQVYIGSANHLVEYEKRQELREEIQKYALQMDVYNSNQWAYFEDGGKRFFIQVYKINGNYVGALVECGTVLDGIVRDGSLVSSVWLQENGGDFQFLSGIEEMEDKEVENIPIPMAHVAGTLMVIVSVKNLFSDKTFLTILSIVTVIVGISLLVWNARYQIRNVIAPLNRLRNVMLRFSQGDLEARLERKNTGDEIDVLYSTFNQMAEQIVHLKIDIYEAQLARERTESNYVRLQIQPHFYTNILNLIYGLAQLKNFDAIQELAMTSGKYFRYLLGEKGTFVLLREEITCVKNYIRIQQIRYRGGMEFEMDVQDGVEKQMVLPLILQTFAENSVKHNSTLVPLLRIKIEITMDETQIHILVHDNGAGFAPEILEKIERNENISSQGEHIGIINVKERLRLFYGDEAQVKIDSSPGNTVVRVILPIIVSQEECNEYFDRR